MKTREVLLWLLKVMQFGVGPILLMWLGAASWKARDHDPRRDKSKTSRMQRTR